MQTNGENEIFRPTVDLFFMTNISWWLWQAAPKTVQLYRGNSQDIAKYWTRKNKYNQITICWISPPFALINSGHEIGIV